MMYFIHEGIVNMYMIDGPDEIQVEQLHELDCFGLVSGPLTVNVNCKFRDRFYETMILFVSLPF